MSQPRTIPLFDPEVQPPSWNERMLPGEYAILYSHGGGSSNGPVCRIFSSLNEAETYAAAEVAKDHTIRCRIYDHEGLGRPAVSEFRGVDYKGESEITPRFRRWVGSILFLGGLILTFVDWRVDFKLSWPAMLGTRMIPVGLLLLFIEFAVIFEARERPPVEIDHHEGPSGQPEIWSLFPRARRSSKTQPTVPLVKSEKALSRISKHPHHQHTNKQSQIGECL